MRINETGWLENVDRRPSPNFDARPAEAAISLIIVHGISLPPGEYGGPWIDHLFNNELDPKVHPYFREIAGLRVSSHLLIRRNGGTTQYVSFEDRAWHAGASCFNGCESCNDFSIGIELEGVDDQPYTTDQYRQLVRVCHALILAYPGITRNHIVGHSDVAPGRKTDPGPAFEWPEFYASLDDAIYA